MRFCGERGVGLLALGCMFSTAASAAPSVHVGVAAGVAADMPDAASEEGTRLGPGPEVSLPVRVGLTEVIRLRADLRLGFGSGVDRLTWTEQIDGVDVRRVDTGTHAAYVGTIGLELGLDVVVPVQGDLRPHLGGSLGGAAVAAFHSLRGDTAVLIDPEQNDLDDPRNLDPYTIQMVWSASAAAGMTWRVSERLDLLVEIGYGSAFVPARRLRKSPDILDARREAFGWNPFRATVGLLFEL
jgi:opacity protein-like surface antigen